MPLQRISNTDISLTGSFTFPVISGNTVIQATDNTNAALRITQLGTGNALVVEDSANPDATPFVINSAGAIITGYTQSQSIAGATYQYQMNGANPFAAIRWNSANSLGLTAALGRSRSGTVGTNSIVTSGDTLGTLAWLGDDGTDFIQAASISSAVDGTPGTNDMPGRLVFSTTSDGASTPTERMRIDSSGNVGIGTNSPSTYSSTTSPALTVFGAVSGTSGLINSWDSTTGGAADVGGNISFGGNDGSTANRTFASIKGGKENVTSGNYSAYLSFSTRLNGSPLAERMRITSEGKVLIGATSPIPVGSTNGRTLEVLGTTFDTSGMALAGYNGIYGTLSLGASRGATVGSTSILLNGDQLGAIVFAGDDGTDLATQGASIIAEVDGTPGLNDMPGRLSFRTTADGASTPTERMRITSTGRMLVGTTTENTSGGVLQVSNGITFPATQSASADANTLDDYEEGGWTPTLGGSGGNPTATYSANVGRYTKIGRLVNIQFYIETTARSGGSGECRINGLPFAPHNDSISYTGVAASQVASLTGVTTAGVRTVPNNTFLQIMVNTTNTIFDVSNWGANGVLLVTLSYTI